MLKTLKRIADALEIIARNSDVMRQNQQQMIERSEQAARESRDQANQLVGQLTSVFMPRIGEKNGK